MCASFGMAVMSSFFFTLCDFYFRRYTYQAVTVDATLSRDMSIATIAAAAMFIAQIIALPIYLKLIKAKSKRFAYVTGAVVWIVVAAAMLLLPAEGEIATKNGVVSTVSGTPNWIIIMFGLLLGLGIGGTVFVPHSSFGDVCDVGELYFGERTEGNFSGLTNFLNTTAQAVGLAIPPLIIGLTGYVETNYVTEAQFQGMLGLNADEFAQFISEHRSDKGVISGIFENSKFTFGNGSVQLLPISQPEAAQLAIKLTFILLPIVIMAFAIAIASRYKLTSKLQKQVVELNAREDKDSEEFKTARRELLVEVGEKVNKIPDIVSTKEK